MQLVGNEGGGPGSVRLASAAGRWVLAVAVLGEAMVLLEATVVNVALPSIGRDLRAGVAGLQWTLNGYVLTLAALVLAAGSLSDIYGRRRVFTLGTAVFVAASALCAAAPTIQLLVAARFVQGVGGALLTPGSLAIIDAVFHPDDRLRAIGAWAGLTAVAAAVGPPVGGYLTDAVSWRAVFLVNLPLGAFVIIAAVLRVPETRDPTRAGGLDLRGAALAMLAIAGACFALIQASGGLTPAVITAAAVSLAAAGTFAAVEPRSGHPMLPLELFRSRQFASRHRARAGGLCGARRRDLPVRRVPADHTRLHGTSSGCRHTADHRADADPVSARRERSHSASARGSRWRSGPS